jgi:integrase
VPSNCTQWRRTGNWRGGRKRAAEIAELRAALDVPSERLLIELTLTTGMRSGEVRGLTWDSIDLEGKRLFIERQANRRGEEAATKTEASVRPIPIPAYLVPELKRWKLACPITPRGLVFPGEPNANGERNPIDADILLRNILRRALRKAGLPPLRFHDLRHMAGTLMHEAGVPLKRAQEILGHASERTTLAIYTHSMRRTHDDSADKIAALAGLSAPTIGVGKIRDTSGSVEHEESELSVCLDGSPGRIRNRKEKAGNFSGLAPILYADTPKGAPANDWLSPNTSGFSRTPIRVQMHTSIRALCFLEECCRRPRPAPGR